MSESPLDLTRIELTTPDGQTYTFRYSATVPYEGKDYVVLAELETDANGEEQVLITRLEDAGDGQLTFVVEENEETVEAVFSQYMLMSLQMQSGCSGCCDSCQGCGED